MRRRKDISNRSVSVTYQLRRHDDTSTWSTTSRTIWDLNETSLQKAKSKPWIATDILTLIRNKNKTYNKFCKAKDQKRKDLLHQQFKNYRNILSNLTKKSKENYYKEYFQENKNNLIKVWKGIKDIILIKNITEYNPPFWK